MHERVLLLSAAFGSGHLQAARAVAEACVRSSPYCTAQAVNLDSRVLRLVSASYLTLLERAPGAYRQLYHARVGAATRRLIHTALSPAVMRELHRAQPTLVVATHPFPAAVAAHLRSTGRLTAPVAVVLTDFRPHPLWVHEGVDRYFTASAEAARGLQALGVAARRIHATGIPIRHEFAAPPAPEFSPERRILVMGGGLGLGPIVDSVRSLAGVGQPNLKVTVICGTNEPLKQQLTHLFGADPRMEILGYSHAMPYLMGTSDLLVTKPGGITCSEALASGLPMLLLQPLPGHEEENAAHLARTGAAQVVETAELGAAAEELCFMRPERLALMAASARRAGRPRAAEAVANEIFMISKTNRHHGATA